MRCKYHVYVCFEFDPFWKVFTCFVSVLKAITGYYFRCQPMFSRCHVPRVLSSNVHVYTSSTDNHAMVMYDQNVSAAKLEENRTWASQNKNLIPTHGRPTQKKK